MGKIILFYELFFNPRNNDSYQVFVEDHGYEYSGLLLMLISVIVASVYYLLLGRRTTKYVGLKKWIISLLINSLFVFIFTAMVLGLLFNGNIYDILLIPAEVWLLAIYNAFFSVIPYLILSLIMRYGSIHAKYTPF